MKLGKNKLILSIFLFFIYISHSLTEDKILSTPLINLDKLKPSFEEIDDSKNEINNNYEFIKKKKITVNKNLSSAKFIGLDKITAKTSEIEINLGETKKFGPFEIKVLKCGNIFSGDIADHVAYLQVKDLSVNENEKVFIFNGWTFSSDPSLTPFDHAIYDLQLLNCSKV